MNRRTSAAVLALGLAIGVAGIATARQASEPQTTEKSKLRAQVVKLRTEVDLLELDRDALRESILTQVKNAEATESISPDQIKLSLESQMMMRMFAGREPSKEVLEILEAKDDNERERLLAAASKKQTESVRTAIDSKKKAYADLSSKLAEKRLDLEEAEIQYRSAR